MTSVSGNTAVYQSAPAFVYLGAVLYLGERFDIMRGFAVVLALGGVALVSFFGGSAKGGGSEETSESVLGYLLVSVCVVLYATTQIIRVKYVSAPSDDVPLANSVRFSLMYGMMPVIPLAVACVVMHFLQVEPLVVPSQEQWFRILFQSGVDALFRLFLFAGLLFCTPAFLNVGNLLVLPASCAVDYLLSGYTLPLEAIAGVGLIVTAFLIFAFRERQGPSPGAEVAEDPADPEAIGSFVGQLEELPQASSLARISSAPALSRENGRTQQASDYGAASLSFTEKGRVKGGGSVSVAEPLLNGDPPRGPPERGLTAALVAAAESRRVVQTAPVTETTSTQSGENGGTPLDSS
mmetsp:Transcript_3094/g.6324  ORF Transcript_3094/g.6324 Transcript_3094/m.6324 type:complete len:351 (+) Transcript_3094:516-1568(+)